MIRLAFLGVLFLAGLLAWLAFFVARGHEGVVDDVSAGLPDTSVQNAATPEPVINENYYFLRDLTLDGDNVTLVLFNVGDARQTFVVRDTNALMAARDAAYIAPTVHRDTFALYQTANPLSDAFLQVYRDDTLIEYIACPDTDCADLNDQIDVDYAGLLDAAIPAQRIDDIFDNHDNYLETIRAIAEDPDFMLLDQRPHGEFPAPQTDAHLIVHLPNVITDDPAFNPALHDALVQAAILPLLPDGARLDWVQIGTQGRAVLADKDNNQAVLVDGQQVPFPDVQFYTVRARILGITSLPPVTYDALADATLSQSDVKAAFARFVTGTLPTSCVDCYFLKVEGDLGDTASAYDWQGETYELTYYDLREAP